MKKSILLIFLASVSFHSYSQNSRISDRNTIGWYTLNGTFKINSRYSLLTEYQWRRDNLITDWQQGLLRTALNYKVNDKLSLRAGYAWIETYAYGDIPINGFGKQFTEHRLFEAAVLNDNIGKMEVSHRFMLEQRWLGRYNNAQSLKQDDFFFTNRLRYMYKMQLPLKGAKIVDNTPYAGIYDEILIGFGKNVNENVFDQNRVGLYLGYRFNAGFRMEGGYLSQIVQLGRRVNGNAVFQYNNGLLVNFIFSSDLLQQKKK